MRMRHDDCGNTSRRTALAENVIREREEREMCEMGKKKKKFQCEEINELSRLVNVYADE